MISFGTKVAVLPGTSYGGLFAGHTGTVCKWHRATNKIGVNLDGVRNPESKEGIFWFPENQLGIIQPNRDMDGGTWWTRTNPNIVVVFEKRLECLLKRTRKPIKRPCRRP